MIWMCLKFDYALYLENSMMNKEYDPARVAGPRFDAMMPGSDAPKVFFGLKKRRWYLQLKTDRHGDFDRIGYL